jgi:hypothetical protein
VFYEAQRRNLDQDLGTIRVDGENIWCDPGPITSAAFGMSQSSAQEIINQSIDPGIPWGGTTVGEPQFPGGVQLAPAIRLQQ